MGNRARVRQLKEARINALGIGTRKLKLRLKRLAQTDALALATYLALLIEDANCNAKRWGPGYGDYYYRDKHRMIEELITLFVHQEWVYGVHPSDCHQTSEIIYFEIPGCAQISWHYTHQGRPLPTYEKPWDGLRDSTLPKLLTFIETTFPEIKSSSRVKTI